MGMEREISFAKILVVSCILISVLVEVVDSHEELSICNKPIDVGFILDSSGSVRYHFKREKELVKKLHTVMRERIKDLRVGVLTFSDKEIYYRRMQYYNPRYFDTHMDRIILQDNITRIDKALSFALDGLFLVKFGHRPGAEKVAILITDGRQTIGAEGAEDPYRKAEHMRLDAIHMIIIGIVDVDRRSLEKLDGGAKKLLYAGTLQEDVKEHIIDGNTNLICEIRYQGKIQPCEYKIDIMFVVDSSFSLLGYFDAENHFVKLIAEQFDISDKGSRLGYIRFSNNASTEIRFNDYNDMPSFHDAVDAIPYEGGKTRIDLALKNAEIEFTKQEHKARLLSPEIPQFLLLLTDGKQKDRNPVDNAISLRKLGIQIIVIGIGKDIDAKQMQEIAGPGVKWFRQNSFDELIHSHTIENFRGVTCHGHEHLNFHTEYMYH